MFPLLLLALGMIGIAMASSGAKEHAEEKKGPGYAPPLPPVPKPTSPPPGAKPAPLPMATRNFPAPTAPLPPPGAKVQRRTIPLAKMKPFKTLARNVKLYQAGIPFNKIANEMPFSRAGRPGYPGGTVFVSLGQANKRITVAPPMVFIKLSPENQTRIQNGFAQAMRTFDMSQTTAAFNYARSLAEILGSTLATMNKEGNDVIIQSFIMPPPRAATPRPTAKKAAVAYWRA